MRSRRPLSRSTFWVAALFVLALGALLAPAAQATPRPAKVMTRNLYLGADLAPAIAATSPVGLAVAGTQIWQRVQQTDFPARAKALAREIKDADPALIGLQEAALWRTGPVTGSFTPTASTVTYDYLQSLLDELAAAGAPYVVVGTPQSEADLEGPTTLGFDIRLTQRDAILARKSSVDNGEIKVNATAKGNYVNNLPIPLLGGVATLVSRRGWVSADVTVNKRSFRFVDTHLEAFDPPPTVAPKGIFRYLQAGELLAGPLNTTQPTVLAGDLNGGPQDAPGELPGWGRLLGAGFTDAAVQAGGAGLTSGFSENLLDPFPAFTQRIDHVLTRGNADPADKLHITGTDQSNRTPAGLWPSDHAGVVVATYP